MTPVLQWAWVWGVGSRVWRQAADAPSEPASCLAGKATILGETRWRPNHLCIARVCRHCACVVLQCLWPARAPRLAGYNALSGLCAECEHVEVSFSPDPPQAQARGLLAPQSRGPAAPGPVRAPIASNLPSCSAPRPARATSSQLQSRAPPRRPRGPHTWPRCRGPSARWPGPPPPARPPGARPPRAPARRALLPAGRAPSRGRPGPAARAGGRAPPPTLPSATCKRLAVVRTPRVAVQRSRWEWRGAAARTRAGASCETGGVGRSAPGQGKGPQQQGPQSAQARTASAHLEHCLRQAGSFRAGAAGRRCAARPQAPRRRSRARPRPCPQIAAGARALPRMLCCWEGAPAPRPAPFRIDWRGLVKAAQRAACAGPGEGCKPALGP
jgi:hypothetical protein